MTRKEAFHEALVKVGRLYGSPSRISWLGNTGRVAFDDTPIRTVLVFVYPTKDGWVATTHARFS